MDRDNALTLKAVVLYILNNDKGNVIHDVYYIVKTAFIAQQKHLAKYLCPLFEDKIVALRFGPVPSNLYDALKIARGDKDVARYYINDNLHLIYDAIEYREELYYAKEEPDKDYLSQSAINCLEEALSMMPNLSFGKIVNMTHGKEWDRAFNSDNKEMDYLAIAREENADEPSMTYLRESLELDMLLR